MKKILFAWAIVAWLSWCWKGAGPQEMKEVVDQFSERLSKVCVINQYENSKAGVDNDGSFYLWQEFRRWTDIRLDEKTCDWEMDKNKWLCVRKRSWTDLESRYSFAKLTKPYITCTDKL